jgi:hypothetical protein
MPFLAVLVLFQLPLYYALFGYCLFSIVTVSILNGDNRFFKRQFFYEFAMDYVAWPVFLVIALDRILKEDSY